jgi:hypothetical protein
MYKVVIVHHKKTPFPIVKLLISSIENIKSILLQK